MKNTQFQKIFRAYIFLGRFNRLLLLEIKLGYTIRGMIDGGCDGLCN